VSWRDVVRKLEAKSRRKEKIEWVRESPAEWENGTVPWCQPTKFMGVWNNSENSDKKSYWRLE
jgi:hypothetical protein